MAGATNYRHGQNVQASSSPPPVDTDQGHGAGYTTIKRDTKIRHEKTSVNADNYWLPCPDKGGRGMIKKWEDIQVMMVKPIEEHFRKLGKNLEWWRGVGGLQDDFGIQPNAWISR